MLYKKLGFKPMVLLCLLAIISCKKEKGADKDKEKEVHVPSPFVSKIYEFRQAPGQFTNDLVKTDILVGNAGNGLVSLGGFGGFIVFGFDHSVENIGRADLGIYGNPLIGEGRDFSEPGIVCVMKDENKNGLPDDIWYELAGSEYNASTTVRNYTITYYRPSASSSDIFWKDNQGKEGFILRNQFHGQDYFPSWATGSTISFTGTLVKNTFSAGDIMTNSPLSFGYADNGSNEYSKLQEQYGRGFNTFDIDWAVDAAGKKIALTSIDFIKVYTAQNHNGNPLDPDITNERSRFIGEISTEFSGAIDLKLFNNK
jgi:hypothetical protein